MAGRPLRLLAAAWVLCAGAGAQDFRINTLTSNNAVVVDAGPLVGDDRGGLAVSATHAFISGDAATARFHRDTLGSGASLGLVRDGLVANLASSTVYLLGNGAAPLPHGGGTFNSLIELNGATGVPNGNRITLSTNIPLTGSSSSVGIFSGWDCVVVHNGTRAYRVSLPSGTVTDLGAMATPTRATTENWAYWGIAENVGTDTYLVYVRNNTTVARTLVPSGVTTTVATFVNLGDMASITVSPSQNRWYFHNEGGSQFGNIGESLGYADATFVAASVAPALLTQPASISVLAGEPASFSYTAVGSSPLTYQWYKNTGAGPVAVSGATDPVYSIAATTVADAAAYSVVIANSAGSVTSSPAALTVTAVSGDIFKIVSLTANNPVVVNASPVVGDDRGGIAVSDTHAFLSGDTATGRFPRDTLTGGASLGVIHDSLVANLATSTVYLLGNGATPLGNGGGTLTSLLELNGTTGITNGNRITLSAAIPLTGSGSSVGIFSGWDRIVLHNGTRAYRISLPTGTVTDLGAMATPTRNAAESWAYWGVAENIGADTYIVYISSSTTVSRTLVPNGPTTTVATFENIPDMASFTVSVTQNRWYFHNEIISQFGNFDESLGYADATFLYQFSPPVITTPPQSLAVTPGSNATFTVTATGTPAPTYQWLKNGLTLPGATQPTLTLPAVTLADVGDYTVIVTNSRGAVTSAPPATLALAVNDPPTFTLAATHTANEDAGPQIIANHVTNILPGPADEAAQLVTFTVTNNNNALFSTQPAISPTGTLTYTPATNANGTATVTVIARDNGGTANGGVDTSAAQTFTLTINAVNDAPTIAFATNNVVVPVNGGARTQAGFITTFTPGPADEAAQTVLGYAVTHDNAALFTVAPALAANGTLTFTLAPGALGTATVTVRAQDSGGTANDGVDLSAAQTFTVTVVGVNDAPSFSLAVGQGAAVIAWGPNDLGQTNVPANLTDVRAVASGRDFSMALRSNGTVVAWGDPGYGVLAVPVDLTNAVEISGGYRHAVARRSDGSLVAWGGGVSAGLVTNIPSSITNVAALSAGGGLFNLALKTDGTVVGWGENGFGQLTIPAGLSNVTAISAGGVFSLALRSDGTVVAWGANGSGQSTVPAGLTNIIAISAGDGHSLAVRSDGSVVSWGQLTAVPSAVTNVIRVQAGANESFALRADGTVVQWSELAVRTLPASLVSVTALSARFFNGIAIASGSGGLAVNEDSGPATITGVATSISPGPADEAGQTVSFFVTSDNAALFSVAPALAANGTLTFTPATNAFGTATVTVIAQDNGGTALGGVDTSAAQTFTLTVNAVNDAPSFAVNSGGLLGSGGGSETNVIGWGQQVVFSQGPLDARFTSLAAGLEHNLALRSDGTVVAWGYHSAATVPTGLSGVRAIAAGDQHSLALQSNGVVVAWGSNGSGETSVPAGLSGVTAIAAGDNYSLALKSDGTVVAWGDNGSGQTTVPAGLSGVTAIAAGHRHSLALKSDGTVVGWGENGYGQTTAPAGLSGVTAIAAGVRLSLALKSDGTVVFWGDDRVAIPAGLSGVTAIAAGQDHGMALKSDGTVVAWGIDNFGQVIVPAGLSGVMAIAGGGFHSLALKTDGTVVAWGDVGYRPTPVSPGLSGVKAIAAGNFHTLALKNDGTVVVPWALDNQAGAATVPAGLSGVTAIATRINHNLALKNDGTVVAWGDNGDGQTTVPAGLSGVTAVAAGASQSLALKSDGTVVAWGAGFPVVPTGLNGVTAIAAGAGHNLALKSDGTVVAWGYDAFGQATVPAGLSGVVAVAAGAYHSLALKSDGTVVAWGGYNNSGAETVPVGLSGVTAIAGGWAHSLALKSDGTVVAWGANDVGQAVVPLGLNGVVAIAAGTSHSLALRATGGTGVASPLTVAEDSGPQTIATLATSILAGPANESAQTVAFLVTSDNAGLFSAGPAVAANGTLTFTPAANVVGTATVTVRAQDNGGTANGGVDTSAAQTFTITVTPVDDVPTFSLGSSLVGAGGGSGGSGGIGLGVSNSPAQVFGWGNNRGRQVAPVSTNILSPVEAPGWGDVIEFGRGYSGVSAGLRADGTVWTAGSGAVLLGHNNAGGAGVPGQVTSISGVVRLASGWAHNMALKADGTVWVWGNNSSGQLGDGTFVDNGIPFPVAGLPAISRVSSLHRASLAMTVDGSVWAWGDNNGGAVLLSATNILRLPTLITNIPGAVEISGGHTHILVLTGDGQVWAWGTGHPGVTSTPTLVAGLSNITAVAAGKQHSLALRSDGSVWAWGYNNFGQLGLGDQTERSTPTLIAGLSSVLQIAAGDLHSVARTADGRVHTWGGGNVGWDFNGLGQGDLNLRLMPTPVPGLADVTVIGAGLEFSQVKVGGTTLESASTSGSALVVGAGSGARTLVGAITGIAAGGADEAGQSVTFLVTSSNPGLFLVQPAISAGGTLTFTPAAGVSGLATITVRAQDSGGTSAPITFTITVSDGNQPPAVTLATSLLTVLEDAGAQTVANFVASTSPGPAHESTQTVSVVSVTTATASLFSAQPALAANGTLTFTPATNANGSTLVTLILQDNGGTATGGVDRSTNTFTITVTSVNDAPSFALPTGTVAGRVLQAWGQNANGQLGDGTTTTRHSPGQVGASTDWQSVTAGAFSTLAMKSDGTLWAWGNNSNGRLGDGTTVDKASPVQIGAATDWQSVAGSFHTVAVKRDGTLWAWGQNSAGQMGDGTTIDRHSPVQIGTATNWQSVAAGGSHTLAVRSDGTLWAWGLNALGRLGDGTTADKTSPVQIGTATNWQSVAAGGDHSLALKSDGTLWAWGYNGYGQLGDGTTASKSSPVQLGSTTDWQSVEVGSDHTLALKSDGTLWAWGSNDRGQLGDGTTTERHTPVQIGTATNWQSVAAGGSSTLALKSGGTLWAWGFNNSGQLGDGTTTESHSPLQIGTATNWQFVTTADNHTVALAGTASAGPYTLAVLENEGVQTVAGFATNILTGPPNESSQVVSFVATNNNNALFFAQPAIGTNGTLTFTPATNAFGTATVTVLAQDNGGTANGGVDTSAAQTFTITVNAVNDVPTLAAVSDAAAASSASPSQVTVGLSGISAGPGESGLLSVVASSSDPSLIPAPSVSYTSPSTTGTLTFTPVANATGTVVITVTVREDNDADGTIDAQFSRTFNVTFGTAPVFPAEIRLTGTGVANIARPPAQPWVAVPGYAGEFTVEPATGLGPITYQWFRDGQALAGVTGTNYAIAAFGHWVQGDYTVVATSPYGSATSSVAALYVPNIVGTHNAPPYFEGTDANENFYVTLPRSATNLSAIAFAKQSDNIFVGLKPDGTVLAFGRTGPNVSGGADAAVATNAPAGLTNVTAVAAGWQHALALRVDGSVIAWGDNAFGQTNVPVNATNVVAIAAGGNTCLALRADGTVVEWGGLAESFRVPIPADLANVVGISVGNSLSGGYTHCVAVLADGTVRAWGDITGSGSDNVPPAGLSNIVLVAAGDRMTVAIRRDGTVTGWGEYSAGAAIATYLGDVTNAVAAVAQRSTGAMILLADGTVRVTGGVQNLRPPGPGYHVTALAGSSRDFISLVASSGAPVLTTVPRAQSAFLGGTVQLTALALAPGGASYQWFLNGNAVAGATSGTLTLNSIQANQAGNCTVVVTNASGSVTSSVATVTVFNPPVLSSQPVGASVAVGGSATFSVTATGGSPLAYQWSRNGVAVADATNSSLALSNVQVASAGDYQVVVTNAYGAVTSSVARLTVGSSLNDDLVAWYPLDGDLLDYSGNARHGTATNFTPSYLTGPVG